jgi:putative phosphoserine phosphatase/1-acylglycerol-3-phosphate O-acyltransferase
MARSFLTQEIERGPGGPRVGAFFDLDGTLIAGFSATAFWRDRLLSGQLSLGDVFDSAATGIAFQRGRVGFSGLLTALASLLRGTPEKEMEETGERLFLQEFAALIYPESRALVEAHLLRGHTVVIVSAATRYQVEPIARDLGVEHVLCSRLEVVDGVFTGRSEKPYCFGEGKLTAARELAEREGVDLAESYFYTDSADDLALLHGVGRPRPTNPDKRLASIARRAAWPVQSFASRGRPGISEYIRTALTVNAMSSVFLLALPAALLARDTKPLMNATMGAWGDLGTALAGIELQVEGEEHLWSDRPAVFIFNHQSAIDVLLLCKLLRRDFVGVAKRELRRVPLFGLLSSLAGTVFIDRGNTKKAIDALKPALETLRDGTSLVIAPEGTRTPTPRLAPFKKGAFHMAMEAGVPIVPIVFKNSLDALPKHGLVLRPATIQVEVLPPIPTTEWTADDLGREIAAIRSAYERVLAGES